MSFWGFFGKTFWGVDPDEDAQRSAELDAELQRMNADALATGRWDEETYEMAETHRVASASDPAYSSDLWEDFYDGAAEGLAKEQKAVKGALTSTVGTLAAATGGFIPWWLWLVGAGFLAFRAGLFKGMLKRIL